MQVWIREGCYLLLIEVFPLLRATSSPRLHYRTLLLFILLKILKHVIFPAWFAQVGCTVVVAVIVVDDVILGGSVRRRRIRIRNVCFTIISPSHIVVQ